MSIDKNKAVLEFLSDCPVIKDNPLYFNFADAEDNNSQYLTSSTDVSMNKTFVDGSKLRVFTFTLVTFKSISNNAIIKEDTEVGENPVVNERTVISENVEDMFELQEIIDWVNEQGEEHNYPNFGDRIVVDDMQTSTDTPYFEGVDTGVSPALAMYSIAIRIDYIDYTKTICY